MWLHVNKFIWLWTPLNDYDLQIALPQFVSLFRWRQMTSQGYESIDFLLGLHSPLFLCLADLHKDSTVFVLGPQICTVIRRSIKCYKLHSWQIWYAVVSAPYKKQYSYYRQTRWQTVRHKCSFFDTLCQKSIVDGT